MWQVRLRRGAAFQDCERSSLFFLTAENYEYEKTSYNDDDDNDNYNDDDDDHDDDEYCCL